MKLKPLTMFQEKNGRLLLIIGIIVIIALIITLCFSLGHTNNTIIVQELKEVPTDIKEKFDKDVLKPGMYTYEQKDKKIVLLTFGEVSGIGMTTEVTTSKDSVYFNVNTKDLDSNEIVPIYKLFETNAKDVSCNELKLISPTYGVGTVGSNIGYLVKEKKGEYYITPLLDISLPDRVFKTASTVGPLANGLYQYEYEVRDNGVFITTATLLNNYQCSASVRDIDLNNNTAGFVVYDVFSGQKVLLNASLEKLSKEQISLLQEVKEYGYPIDVTFACDSNILYVQKAQNK